MILRINILGVLCALALINPLSMMGQDKQFTLHDLIPGGKTQDVYKRQLQFLVLSVEVRILVRQLTEQKGRNESFGPFCFCDGNVSFLHD